MHYLRRPTNRRIFRGCLPMRLTQPVSAARTFLKSCTAPHRVVVPLDNQTVVVYLNALRGEKHTDPHDDSPVSCKDWIHRGFLALLDIPPLPSSSSCSPEEIARSRVKAHSLFLRAQQQDYHQTWENVIHCGLRQALDTRTVPDCFHVLS